MADKGATIMLVGLKGQPGPIDFDQVVSKALTLKGTNGPGGEGYREAVALINSRSEQLSPLHTHSFPLSEAEAAIRTLNGELPSDLTLGVTVTA
jgi:L-idonate 5-dehydrogenase